MMIDKCLKKVTSGEDLTFDESYECMQMIMRGEVSQIKISAFLTALKMKEETVDEIYAFAKVMRENALSVDGSQFDVLVDTCGTGGDGINTFNISTSMMFILAANGINIAKHGNKAMTSKSGAADVLESLGANISLDEKQVFECIKKTKIGFIFAMNFHASMKNVAPIRRDLPYRTVFNILGPLSNPANANVHLMGIFDKNLIPKVVNVFKKLGIKKAAVVSGCDGMDEITLTGKTYVAELNNGQITEYEINPEDYGFSLCKLEDLVGGTPDENAEILRGILNGEKGAKSDIVILNAGVAIYVTGVAGSIEEGIKLAKEAIANKKALEVLHNFVKCTNEV